MDIRTLAKGTAMLAVISAIVTANLWGELRAERQRTAALKSGLTDSAGPSIVVPAPAPAAPTHADADIPHPAAPARTVPARPSIQRAGAQDAEYQKVRLAMLRSAMAQAYPGLAEELGLSGGEAERLFELLAENQMALASQMTSALGGDGQADRAAAQEAMQARLALQRQHADTLRQMLGEARYSQWQAYLPTRGVRMQASNYASAMNQAGSPLADAQLKTLVTAMLGEQKNLQRDIVNLGRSVDPNLPESRARAQEALRSRRSESSRRILEATSPALDPRQQDLLRGQLERQGVDH